MRALRLNSKWFWVATLALLPFLASWPVTSGWVTIDPIYWHSGLAIGLRAGPLLGQPALDGAGGWVTEALGRLAANEWMSGRIPWWNSYSGPGLPLAAGGSNPALFLPFVLLLALPNGLSLLKLVLQEIAAFSSYALLRRMDMGPAASWVGAALYCVGGGFAWLGEQPAMMPIAFAPLLLLGIEMEWKAARERTRSRGRIVAAAAVAMSLYAGFPETAYIDGLLGAAWAIQRLACLPRDRRLQFAGRIAGAATSGVLVAAPWLIPFLHLLSVGDLSLHAGRLDQGGASADLLAAWSIPYVLGPPIFALADGTNRLFSLWANVGGDMPVPELVLGFAAILCRGGSHRGLRLVLGAFTAATVGAAFGIPGVAQAVYAIPWLAHVWLVRYAPPACELAIAVLVAMAIDDWQRGRIGRRPAIGSAASVGLAVALSLVAARHWVTLLLTAVESYVWWLATSVAAAAIAAVAVTACVLGPPTKRRLCVALAALAGYPLALFMVPQLAGFREAKIDEGAIEFLRQGLGLQRFYAVGTITPHYGAYFDIASLNSLYLPNPQTWSDEVATALDSTTSPYFYLFTGRYPTFSDNIAQLVQHLPAYAALSVRYAVVPPGTNLPLKLAYEDGLMRIFEVETAAPYFEAHGDACRVDSKSRELVVTECDRPSRLIRRELFFDGWHATVNGKSVDIGQEGIVQAVEVPAGPATVTFRYIPPHAGVSAGLALVGILVLIGGGLLADSSWPRFAWRRLGSSSCPLHSD
jgi:hypothetical protein